MNASKENCQKTRNRMETVILLAEQMAEDLGNPNTLDKLKEAAVDVFDFLNVAERKLPNEASFEKQKAKKKS